MPTKDELDLKFRVATEEMRGDPVRWDQVERQARRHERAAVRRLGIWILAVTALIAGSFVAAKLLFDSAYRAQFTSASSSVTFGEDANRRGTTELKDYLRRNSLRPSTDDALALSEEGFEFQGKLKLTSYRGGPLITRWALLSASSGKPASVATAGTPALHPKGSRYAAKLSAWISYPPTPGRYRVALTLQTGTGEVVSRSEGHAFTVTSPRISKRFRSPGYDARLPTSGWKLVEKYARASPDRFVTKMVGPAGTSLLIDTTRHVKGDPATSARVVEALYHGLPSYKRVAFRSIRGVGAKAFAWSFDFEGLQRVDLFFYEADSGYAILVAGPPRDHAELDALALKIARSIRPRS